MTITEGYETNETLMFWNRIYCSFVDKETTAMVNLVEIGNIRSLLIDLHEQD